MANQPPKPSPAPAPAPKPAPKPAPAARPTPAAQAQANASAASKSGPRPANRPAPANRPMPTRQQAMAAHGAQVAQMARGPGGEPFDDEEFEGGGSHFLMFNAVPSWLTSMIFHIVLLLVLAMVTFGTDPEGFMQEFTMGKEEEEVEEIEEFEDVEVEELEVDTEVEVATDLAPVESEVETPDPVDTPTNDPDQAAIAVELNPLGETAAPKNDMLATVGSFTGTGLEGRGAAARAQAVRANGGSKGSEEAVARALKWIASRQSNTDGGWNFDHNLNNPVNPQQCPDPGSAKQARNGATGMALLPFLGAGQTHMEGKYKKQVGAGLAYLVKNMKVNNRTGSFHEAEGSMYSHGIASIVLCEAYAMTHDKQLLAPAQLALNFIVDAQDPVGGGWRYQPKQKGDTSAVGWQLMALKSGHMAYLEVPPGTIKGAMKFLDSVQADSGSQYGYTGPATGKITTTSIGLLSRMYLGWKHDNPAMQRGVDILDKKGPSTTNMYYNYYATQVARHYEGEVWKRWNARMRDWLVAQQSREGVTDGSWYFRGGDHGSNRGGRLYCTSMATMVLEVYYRHLPIYRKQAAEEDFPL